MVRLVSLTIEDSKFQQEPCDANPSSLRRDDEPIEATHAPRAFRLLAPSNDGRELIHEPRPFAQSSWDALTRKRSTSFAVQNIAD